MIFGVPIIHPIHILLMMLGYLVMFVLASYIAPKVANKFAGRFSLYTSMILVSLLIILSSVFVLFIIFYVLVLQLGIEITEFSITILSLIIFVVISNLLVYIFSPILINLIYGAREDKKLQKIVDEVKKSLNYKGNLKAVVTQNFTIPNAFAYGNFLFGKYVAVSPGMLKLVTEDELKAVIGHEIGHHMHRDNFIMLLFGILPSIIYYFGYFLIRIAISSHSFNRKDSRGGALPLFFVGLLVVVMSFVVQILVLAFSRLREYFADLEGAKAAGKRSMQSSLVKLHYYYTTDINALSDVKNSKLKTLFLYAFIQTLTNPVIEFNISRINEKDIERVKNSEVSSIQEFLSTHPPIPKRLRFLDTLPY